MQRETQGRSSKGIKNILLTGKPGIGKTTIIKEWSERLGGTGGFYTLEMREGKERVGFKIVTINGKEGILAQKGFLSRFKVGKYGVNIANLEGIGVKSIEESLVNSEIKVIIIDEIGKMELVSAKFQGAVKKALDSSKIVIGVITQAPSLFVKEVKRREDTRVVEVTLENRENLKGSLPSWLPYLR